MTERQPPWVDPFLNKQAVQRLVRRAAPFTPGEVAEAAALALRLDAQGLDAQGDPVPRRVQSLAG